MYTHTETFHLHGITHTHFDSNPQDVLPYVNEGSPVTLKPIHSDYDRNAVAVFYKQSFIGWMPKGSSLVTHSMLDYCIDIEATVKRIYTFDDYDEISNSECGAEIQISYSIDYSLFNPRECKYLYDDNINLANEQKLFLKYLSGKKVDGLIIPEKWFSVYGLNYESEATLYIRYGYMKISNAQETLEHLKVVELTDILKANNLLHSTAKKAILIKRICDNLSDEQLDTIVKKQPAFYILTNKGKKKIEHIRYELVTGYKTTIIPITQLSTYKQYVDKNVNIQDTQKNYNYNYNYSYNPQAYTQCNAIGTAHLKSSDNRYRKPGIHLKSDSGCAIALFYLFIIVFYLILCILNNIPKNTEHPATETTEITEANIQTSTGPATRDMLILKSENNQYKDFIYTGSELNIIKILGKAIAFQSDVR